MQAAARRCPLLNYVVRRLSLNQSLFPYPSMNMFRVVLLALAANFPVAGCAGAQSAGPEAARRAHGTPADSALRALVPTGTTAVWVMGMVPPAGPNEIMLRLQAAMRRDQAFWQQYILEHSRPGQPLPYHVNMGVTRAEYDEALRLMRQIRLAKVGEATLTVRDEGNGPLVLDGGRALPQLTGVVIDLAANQVQTPFGVAARRTRVSPGPEQAATGPWEGELWSREAISGGGSNGVSIKFGVGRLQEGGRGILYYEVKQVAGGRVASQASSILTYDIPSR